MITYFPNPLPGAFNRKVFDRIVSNIKGPFDAVSTTGFELYNIFPVQFTEPVVIIDILDNLSFDDSLGEPKDFAYFRQLAIDNPNKTIVLLLEGNFWTQQHFAPLTNIRVVQRGTQCEDDVYPTIQPVEKNFDSTVVGISLNRQMRQHRIALISLLYGLQLNRSCRITAHHLYKQLDKMPTDDFMSHNNWKFRPDHDKFKQVLQMGFGKIVNLYTQGDHFQPTAEDIYPIQQGAVMSFTNYNNFEKHLRHVYSDSFVEIISCLLYNEPTHNLDEKYINSVYARNFPIVVGSHGMVEFYRSLGFDVFDDIVDHSYDTITDPVDRLARAILSNQQLLVNSTKTKELWKSCEDRFNKNIDFARKNLYNVYEWRVLASCNREIPDLLKEEFICQE